MDEAKQAAAAQYLRRLHEGAERKTRERGGAGSPQPNGCGEFSHSTTSQTGASSPSGRVSGDVSRLDETHMRALWRRLAAMYGDGWTRQYGAQDDGTWLAGCRRAGLTPQSVGAGLQAVLTSGAKWPPSLPEFLALCRPHMGVAGGSAARAAPSKALPLSDEERVRRREVAAAALAECRRILAGRA